MSVQASTGTVRGGRVSVQACIGIVRGGRMSVQACIGIVRCLASITLTGSRQLSCPVSG